MSDVVLDEFILRPVGEEHVPLVARWRSDPAVLEWYGGRDRPLDEAAVRDRYIGAGDPSVLRFVVYRDGTAIGFAQVYPSTHDVGWHRRIGAPAEPTWGMDQFIGEPALWGQGIGSRLVAAVAAWLRAEMGAARVVLDVQQRNARAIRAYEKAGFRKVRLLLGCELHEGDWQDCWLMEHAD